MTEKKQPTTLDEALASTAVSVEKYARKWHAGYRTVPLDDLLQACRLGTVFAWDRFDPTINKNFLTYAVYWWLRECREVVQSHIGFGIRNAVYGKLTFVGVMHASVLDSQKEGLYNDGAHAGSFMDKIFPTRESRGLPPANLFKRVVRELSPLQAKVVLLRFKHKLRFSQIAAKLGVTEWYAKRHLAVAVQKLREVPWVAELSEEVSG